MGTSSIELAPGDVIMAATDGLWDNVFDAEAAQLLFTVAGQHYTPAAAADTLAQFAHMRCASRRLFHSLPTVLCGVRWMLPCMPAHFLARHVKT